MMDEKLLRKYGYHLAASGLGDMSADELLTVMRDENGWDWATYEDAEVAINAAYSELWAFQSKMSKKSKGWEALKQDD